MCACYRSRRVFWTSLWVGIVFLAGLLPAVHADCPGNALANGGFEDGFSTRNAGEVEVANGWNPWWQDGPFQDQGLNRRPEYDAENAGIHGTLRIREGNFGQKWGNVFATHHAGVYQRVNVPAGSTVTFSVWGQAWSSRNDDPNVSDGGKYSLSVGIDPTGGTDRTSPNVVWSAPSEALDQWVQLSVEAVAQGGAITVFLRGDAEWPVKHNDAYFDDACLTYVVPPPPPTNTPRPTEVPTETPTPEPSATPTLTPTPKLGVVRVLAFDDLNGNGVRESNEPLLAGARIMIADSEGTVIAEHVTDGVSEPYAFEDLDPGQYAVVEQDPPGYASTSSNRWLAPISYGSELEVFFADEYRTVTATATAAPPVSATSAVPTAEPSIIESGSPAGFEEFSGILVALVALVLPVGLRVIRGRL